MRPMKKEILQRKINKKLSAMIHIFFVCRKFYLCMVIVCLWICCHYLNHFIVLSPEAIMLIEVVLAETRTNELQSKQQAEATSQVHYLT